MLQEQGLGEDHLPTATKYTFVEPFHLRQNIADQQTEVKQLQTENCRSFSETSIIFQIHEDICQEDIQSIGLPAIDLPKGATLLKATDEEILVEVEDTLSVPNTSDNHNKSGDFKPNIKEGNITPIQEKQNLLLYLGDDVIEVEVAEEQQDLSKVTKRRKNKIQEKKYACTWKKCDKTFVAKHSVSIHIRNVHLSESVECSQCGKSYSNEENLKVHVRTIHGAVATPCKWPGCPRVLSSERQMQSHYLKHSEKPQNCPYLDCYSVLKNSSVLRTHIKKMHREPMIPEAEHKAASRRMGAESVTGPPTITTYKLK